MTEIRRDGGYQGSVVIENPSRFTAPQSPSGLTQPAPRESGTGASPAPAQGQGDGRGDRHG